MPGSVFHFDALLVAVILHFAEETIGGSVDFDLALFVLQLVRIPILFVVADLDLVFALLDLPEQLAVSRANFESLLGRLDLDDDFAVAAGVLAFSILADVTAERLL